MVLRKIENVRLSCLYRVLATYTFNCLRIYNCKRGYLLKLEVIVHLNTISILDLQVVIVSKEYCDKYK